ncbi:nicotinate phosphoribosyltransferase [Brevibacillus sp. B_LB10_24]|uniref:nicotinate phosphoribosyltransferase n=1 Tax=Brevibacillus sp. B_LB10_24 TaxID=3380645 RepID=UPI0038BB9E0E
MRNTKTIFDLISPKQYRFIHVCQSCGQPAFRHDDNPDHECVVCRSHGRFDAAPYFNPAEDYALDVDFYAITMMYALWKQNLHLTPVVFDDFYRKAPFVKSVGEYSGELGGYVAFGGLGHLIEIIQNLYFNEDDIAYLREREERFDEAFLDDLRRLSFTGDLYAVQEGNIIFPNTPFIRIVAPVWECIWIEAMLLNTINAESLQLTKGSRIATAAGGDTLLEMGKRRAQGRDASVYGAKMAYIAGFSATSNVKAGKHFGVPITGTMAHLYVMFHPSELDAFLSYAEVFPHRTVPLLDTTDTLRSGAPNAIQAAKVLKEKGFRLAGVRLDSGDLAYLSKEVRKMFDAEGLDFVKIAATNDLDEYTITSLKQQKAQIDIWGVGTKFITAYDQPALGGVHKIVARKPFDAELGAAANRKTMEDWIALIKISESMEKILNPGLKKAYRLYDENGMAKGDYICLEDEVIQGTEMVLRHPTNPLKSKTVRHFTWEELHQPIFLAGRLVYEQPSLDEIRKYHQEQKAKFWDEYMRVDVPEVYPMAISDQLRKMKERMVFEKLGMRQ